MSREPVVRNGAILPAEPPNAPRTHGSRVLHMLALGSLLAVAACEWFVDFKRQPSVWTWEPAGDSLFVRAAPQMSVPLGGSAMAGLQVSYNPGIAQIESLAVVANPVPMSDSSLANGYKYYQLNCTVCHGDRALGDGSAVRFGMAGINLTLDLTKNRSDGYIWGMIRNGRGLMPSYNRIEERDRWDVVNYLRALQGNAGALAFATGPVARPGVTGAALPGATPLGPNRWVRHVMPNVKMTPRGEAAAGDHAPRDTAAPPATRDTTRHDGAEGPS
ncbi:MAG: c-type cytochrome [Gemmatimonadaceae bacterium]